MRADRLLKLADYLETVPRDRFDMTDWSNMKTGCGFSGCAIGWAHHGKLFPGLAIRKKASDSFSVLHYRGETHLDAAALLFKIDSDSADDLFGPAQIATPKQVAKRIRKFVRDHSLTDSAR